MNTDIFSFKRLSKLWNFYWPVSKKHLMLIALLSISAYFIVFLGQGMFSMSFGSWVLSLCFYSGPLLFAFYQDRTLSVGLPASVGEKCVFQLAYVYLIIPAIIATLVLLSAFITSFFSVNYNPLESVSFLGDVSETIGKLQIDISFATIRRWQLLGEIFPPMLALYVIARVRRSQLLYGIIALVLGVVGVGFLSGFVSGACAFYEGFNSGISGMEIDKEKLVNDIIYNIFNLWLPITYSISGLTTIFVLWLYIRKMKKVQV